MIGVIGGSGFENFNEFETVEILDRQTPFGETSSGFKKVKVSGTPFLFISRHGAHHELLPSEVNYRANIFALKKEGVQTIVSFSAVGSLRAQYKPGDLVIPFQYVDRTKGLRRSTFLGEGAVGHISLAYPVDELLSQRVYNWSQNEKEYSSFCGQTYLCIEGPFFSTRAESLFYREMGSDIIGMTHFPEYALAREAGLSYVPCCFVTDYDCWDDSRPHVTVEEVVQIMKKNNSKAFELLKKILTHKDEMLNSSIKDHGLKAGLMSSLGLLPQKLQEAFQVLLG